ncbi:hypothetical protein HPB49_012083 [Dermacentor silvarum]|uniref:Uncharacterized protein n=1 Tax=Dermacentor silvarum TaxID=543639 RepID=A0ACB8DJ67_DERSI|nr:hypothetical protein HPB49_012083 [Dermacentor silvarum]
MNSSHLAALAPESEDIASNWYRNFAMHPFYQPLGVNSGVMLMNLTRMRQFGWEEAHGPLLRKYGGNMSFGDQDLLNILFSAHPERLLLLSCRWNYRTDHCDNGAYCTRDRRLLSTDRSAFLRPSQRLLGTSPAMRQGTFSIVLMAVVNPQYKFSMVSVGAPGLHSDGGVFKSCEFGRQLEKGTLPLPNL